MIEDLYAKFIFHVDEHPTEHSCTCGSKTDQHMASAAVFQNNTAQAVKDSQVKLTFL